MSYIQYEVIVLTKIKTGNQSHVRGMAKALFILYSEIKQIKWSFSFQHMDQTLSLSYQTTRTCFTGVEDKHHFQKHSLVNGAEYKSE